MTVVESNSSKEDNKKHVYIDLSSETCGVGLALTWLDDETTGITLFRGSSDTIAKHMEVLGEQDNVIACLGYTEKVEDIVDSTSAIVLAALAKLLFEGLEESDSHGILDNILKDISRN